MPRIPYGLDRLPRTMSLDDPRLRCALVGDEPLRLNSEPLPADAMPLAIGDHAARVTAAKDWLESLCGDYAPLQRQFIASYFALIATHLEHHRNELLQSLRPYDTLYAPEDFLWSALRPLPRAWVPIAGRLLPADMVFWDGTQAIAIELSQRETERGEALRALGVRICRFEPSAPHLPEMFRRFWTSQVLPTSPFRRPIPRGVVQI